MAEYIEREAAKKVLAFGVGVTAANALDNVPAVDVVPVVQLEEVKTEILSRMGEFITEYRFYSESTVDHFGGKADAMDVAKRLVNAALTDLIREVTKKGGDGHE